MGKVKTCNHRIELFRRELRTGEIVKEVQCWKQGRITEETLKDEVWAENLSFLPGYVNEHVTKSFGYIPHYYKAQVIDQKTGEVKATYKDPAFLAWNPGEVEKYLASKGKNVAKKVSR